MKNLTFSRMVILLSLLGSVVLGYLNYVKGARLNEMELEVANAPKLAAEIQQLSLQLKELQYKSSRDSFSALDDADLYVRTIAQEEKVSIGSVNVDPGERDVSKGIVDKIYSIVPTDKKRPFTRVHISNFLYSLEEKSPRLRVTRFEMESPGRSVRPHEIGDDRWTFEAEITSRQRVE